MGSNRLHQRASACQAIKKRHRWSAIAQAEEWLAAHESNQPRDPPTAGQRVGDGGISGTGPNHDKGETFIMANPTLALLILVFSL
jgi:hypothetical protein